jgi:aminotransferase
MAVDRISVDRVHCLSRPGSKVLDEQIDRLRHEQPPGPLKLSGYPTDPLPPHIIDAIARAARENAIAPSAGLRDLRDAIAEKLASENNIKIDSDSQVLITHGAMHAVHLILQVILEPGDEVLMFSPTYFFGGLIELVRGKPVYAPLNASDGYRFQVEALERKVTRRTRALIWNCPCNPTGCVATANELRDVARFARRHNLLIVSDESYEKFVYDARRSVSIGSIDEARPRTITIQSFTKSYGMAGWRLGYMAGPKELIAAAQKVLEWTGLMCNYPAQVAATAALRGPKQWFEQIVRRFQENRDVLMRAVEAAPGLSAIVPASTPFVLVDVSRLSDAPSDLSRRLLVEQGIPSVAGEAFQAPGHLRIPFGGTTEVVEKAAHRLKAAFAGDSQGSATPHHSAAR